MDWASLIVGALLGIGGSVIAANFWDQLTRPKLTVRVNSEPAHGVSWSWYNVTFTNCGCSPRPAWACKATLAILSDDGSQVVIGPIEARWTSTPEPLTPLMTIAGQVVQLVDLPKVLAGRRIDIYAHEEQMMPILIKHDGQQDCYLFTNESYYYPPDNTNPAWRLGVRKHRLRITAYYERGTDSFDFCIHNYGAGRDEVIVTPIPLDSTVI